MDSDDKVFLKEISEKLDHIAAQTIDPIKEIRENIEKKIGPIHHVYPYTVEERLVLITEKLEQMGHDVFENKDLHIRAGILEERLKEVEDSCGAIFHQTIKLHEKGQAFRDSFKERVPEDLDERLDRIEFQLKSLTALVSLLCTHFGVSRPLKQKEEEDESEDPAPL